MPVGSYNKTLLKGTVDFPSLMMDLKTCFLPNKMMDTVAASPSLQRQVSILRNMFSDTRIVKFDESFDFQKTVRVLNKEEWICTMRGYGIALILFQDEIVKIEDTVRKEIIEIIWKLIFLWCKSVWS